MPVTYAEAEHMFVTTVVEANRIFGRDLFATGWAFKTNRRKRALGICNYTKKTIEISEHYLAVNTKEQILDTVRHEVAHAIAGVEANHGPKWRQVHRALGGSGKAKATTGTDTNSVKASYQLVNTVNGQVVAEYYRKPRRDFSKCIVNGDRNTLGKLKLVKV